MSKRVVDSRLTQQEILKQNPRRRCPVEILDQIVVVSVNYYSFDNIVHAGQVAIHKDLANDIIGAFELLLKEKFPIQSVIPISDSKFAWSDDASIAVNNTSAYNYRNIRDTFTLSNHATGRAIDINPKLNPYFPGQKVFPPHATYNPAVKGTILADSKLVTYFEKLGWQWGGNWNEDLDFQHFEKE